MNRGTLDWKRRRKREDEQSATAGWPREDDRPIRNNVVMNRRLQPLSTREEIATYLAALRPGASDQEAVANYMLDHFASVTEPKSEINMQLITAAGLGRPAVSRKPGNILLNWRKLFDTSPDVLVAAAGAGAGGAFVRGLIGLYVWNRIWRGIEEPISEVEASVIESLWCGRGARKRIPEDVAFDIVNDSRVQHGLEQLSRVEFTAAVDRLVGLRCVELDDGEVWLREWIRKKT